MANGLVSYKEKAERLSTQLRNLKNASAAPLQALMVTGSGAVVGGLLAGAIDAKAPKVGPVPTGPAVGAVLCIGAILNAEHSWSQNVNAVGTTLLGLALARETYSVLTAPASV
jgi:hypothetical protein